MVYQAPGEETYEGGGRGGRGVRPWREAGGDLLPGGLGQQVRQVRGPRLRGWEPEVEVWDISCEQISDDHPLVICVTRGLVCYTHFFFTCYFFLFLISATMVEVALL
jgi:hypothetical protein